MELVIILFITREYDYALRTIRALTGNEQLTVSQICSSEHIPQPYAYKILKKLEKALIVRSRRGTHGGYRLNISLRSLTLYDVYIALEETFHINECLREGYSCPNNENGRQCLVHEELCHMQDDFVNRMRSRSLAEIMGADR